MSDTATISNDDRAAAQAALQRADQGPAAEQLELTNVMQVPTLDKIVINMGVGRATQQPSQLEAAVVDLTAIAGQKPIVTKAKHSIAGFKLREGQSIGTKVTLRGDRMWEFLDRLIAVAIPRIRDFRGLPATSWDGRGNYTFGLNDQTVFPEIDYDKIDTTGAWTSPSSPPPTNDAAGKALLDAFGFPFRTGADRAGRRDQEAYPWSSSAAASPPRGSRGARNHHGQESTDQQGCRQAQVQGPRLHPLPSLRACPLGVPQVRAVPCVPARARPRRRDPRSDEVELVRRQTRC